MHATKTTNIVHELGHWLGLLHPKEYLKESIKKGSISTQNVMHHPDDEWEDKETSSYHTTDEIQFLYTLELYRKKALNYGTNRHNPKEKRSGAQTEKARFIYQFLKK